MDRRDKAMHASAIFWLVFFRLRNAILPFRLTRKWASEEVIIEEQSKRSADKALILEVVRAIRRCKRFVPGANCLTQALATKAVLKRFGQDSDIRLGVAKTDVSIDAHAWVEIDGHIIFGELPNNARFSLLRPPSWS